MNSVFNIVAVQNAQRIALTGRPEDWEARHAYQDRVWAQYREENICDKCGTDCHNYGFYCERCDTLICAECECEAGASEVAYAIVEVQGQFIVDFQ